MTFTCNRCPAHFDQVKHLLAHAEHIHGRLAVGVFTSGREQCTAMGHFGQCRRNVALGGGDRCSRHLLVTA